MVAVRFLQAIFILMIFTSCNDATRKPGVLYVKLPQQLTLYNFSNGIDTLVKVNKSDNYRVYTLIDVSCSTCLLKIEKWNDFYLKLKNYNIQFFPICYTKDNFELLKYLFENNTLQGVEMNLYLDPGKIFIENNKNLINKLGEFTALTDAKNKIIINGDPIMNSDISKLYFEKISDAQ